MLKALVHAHSLEAVNNIIYPPQRPPSLLFTTERKKLMVALGVYPGRLSTAGDSSIPRQYYSFGFDCKAIAFSIPVWMDL